ncbi:MULTISPECIES: hypothetical protein [Shewanella]|uniref:hypothetical protein n=1 Tax=Shewanella TaxID=22 RepID=UPI000AD5F410|nr:hypothetical protein [Shewanella sp. MSW]
MRFECIIKHYNACQCPTCSFKGANGRISEAMIDFGFIANWLTVPVGLGTMILLGLQPLPIKMSCPACGNTFFASGFRH